MATNPMTEEEAMRVARGLTKEQSACLRAWAPEGAMSSWYPRGIQNEMRVMQELMALGLFLIEARTDEDGDEIEAYSVPELGLSVAEAARKMEQGDE